MTHPTGSLPDEAYYEGLRQADEGILKQIYAEFRQPVVRAIATLGGTEVQGALHFQTALVEAARLVQQENLPGEQPFYEFLEQLATEHFNNRERPMAQNMAGAPMAAGESRLDNTFSAIASWEATPPNPSEPLPPGYAVWRKTARFERQLQQGVPLETRTEPAANRVWRLVLLVLAIAALGYTAYAWYQRQNAPEGVFGSNFSPPESFVADYQLRYVAAADSGTAVVQTGDCDRLLKEADVLYQDGKFEEAQEPLLLLVLDSTASCQSEAWYFLGVLRLELGDPQTAIECLTKIEDLDHFGEDIQWYMALSMLQLAEKEPALHEKAVRALEKVADSTRSEERKEQAMKMLERLK